MKHDIAGLWKHSDAQNDQAIYRRNELEKQFQLPKRLETIIERMPASGCLADIGCDHAYVAIEAVRRGKAARALACDVRKGPLQQAAEHILCAGLAGKIETRLSDGLEKVAPGEADTVVVAGMGGPLMERILQGRLTDFGHFVLSPQSEIPHFRRFLLTEGVQIDEETMLIDEGKYYVIFNVSQRVDATMKGPGNLASHDVAGDMSVSEDRTDSKAEQAADAPVNAMYVTEEDFLYGGPLLRRLDPVLKSFLEKEKTRYEGILGQTDSAEVRTAYQHCMNALEAYR